MKLLLQILFLFLTWFANLNATNVFAKVVLLNYELTSSKTENVKEESTLKIGVKNFARSGIEAENNFPSISKGAVWASVTCNEKREELVQGAGNVIYKSDFATHLTADGKVGKILDKTKLDDITWFTPQAGNTWQIHQTNASNYLRFKYGTNENGSTVDCYLDDVVEKVDSRFIISDAKHSQKAAIVDGQIPGYTTNQTQGYQWIVDGNVTRIDVIGDKGIRFGINKGDDLLPRLEGKITILTNNSSGQIVESSVFKTN